MQFIDVQKTESNAFEFILGNKTPTDIQKLMPA